MLTRQGAMPAVRDGSCGAILYSEEARVVRSEKKVMNWIVGIVRDRG